MLTTHHPFVDVGAWSAARLAKRAHPSEVTPDDLDALVDRIARDCGEAAAATKNGPGYAWWMALAACFPNSPPTHPSRKPDQVSDKVRAQFHGDRPQVGVCEFCSAPAGARWGKSLLPLGESARYVNSGQPGGQAVCRVCRIALWCLPYGAGHNGSTVLTATSIDRPELTGGIADVWVRTNLLAISGRWNSWPARRPRLDIALPVLMSNPAGQVDFAIWRNDNRDPELSVETLSRCNATVLQRVQQSARLTRGLRRLSEASGLSMLFLATDHEYQPEHRLVKVAARVLSERVAGDEQVMTTEDVADIAALASFWAGEVAA